MSSSSDEDDDKLREALAPGFTIDASKASRHLQFINPLDLLCLNYKIFFFSVKKSLSTPAESNLDSRKSNRPAGKSKSTSSQYIAPVVSDDNQKYLAKELTKFLDRYTDIKNILSWVLKAIYSIARL